MNLCSDQHKEVCYEAKTCPVCETIQEMQKDLDSKDAIIADQNEALGDLLKEREAEKE
jgi:hypothetical protein